MRLTDVEVTKTNPSFSFHIVSSVWIFEDSAVAIAQESLKAVTSAQLTNSFRFGPTVKYIVVSGEARP